MTAKRELISKPAAESIKASGGKNDPERYDSILIRAVAIVAEMCRILRKEGRDTWAEAWGQALTKLLQFAIERVGTRGTEPNKQIRNDRDVR